MDRERRQVDVGLDDRRAGEVRRPDKRYPVEVRDEKQGEQNIRGEHQIPRATMFRERDGPVCADDCSDSESADYGVGVGNGPEHARRRSGESRLANGPANGPEH